MAGSSRPLGSHRHIVANLDMADPYWPAGPVDQQLDQHGSTLPVSSSPSGGGTLTIAIGDRAIAQVLISG